MMAPMETPTTPSGLRQYDHLPPVNAILAAWLEPGLNPAWHEQAKAATRDAMPLLARALDRLAAMKVPSEVYPHD